jgi:aminoglycoside phosphotransferase
LAVALTLALAVRGAGGRTLVADSRAWVADGVSGAWVRGARGARLAEDVLADVARRRPGAVPAGPDGLRRMRTDSEVVVVLAGARPAPRLVVKIAWSRAAALRLQCQRRSLAALRAIPDLRDWVDIIPDVVADGTVDGRSYLVETALPGVDGRTLAAGGRRDRAVAAVVEAIAPLYRSTASTVVADQRLRARLLDEPLERVARARAAAAPRPLGELRRELGDALVGRRVGAAWVHGDLWLGNALLREDGSAVTGLVDWEASRELGLPAVDVAQLVLSTRSLCDGRELGLVVRRLLDGRDALSPFERDLIASVTRPGDELGVRAVLLLAWLELVAWRLSQAAAYPQRHWVRRNVDPVLGALAP